jgi:hypothetical protein
MLDRWRASLLCGDVLHLPCWRECGEDGERAESENREKFLRPGPSAVPGEDPDSDQNQTQTLDPSLPAEGSNLNLNSNEKEEAELSKVAEGRRQTTTRFLNCTEDKTG